MSPNCGKPFITFSSSLTLLRLFYFKCKKKDNFEDVKFLVAKAEVKLHEKIPFSFLRVRSRNLIPLLFLDLKSSSIQNGLRVYSNFKNLRFKGWS